MQNGLQAICFDLDGTLYDAGPVRTRMALRLLRRHILRPRSGYGNARILAAYRRALESLRHADADFPGPDAQIELCCRMTGRCDDEVRGCIREWFEETPLDLLRKYIRPGLRDFLHAARAGGIKLAVLSDYPVQSKLRAMGLESYFDIAGCTHDFGIRRLKPDPAGLRHIIKTLDVKESSAIYVGDRSDVDAEAARRAGMRAVIVGSSQLPGAASWTAVKDFREFRRVLGAV